MNVLPEPAFTCWNQSSVSKEASEISHTAASVYKVKTNEMHLNSYSVFSWDCVYVHWCVSHSVFLDGRLRGARGCWLTWVECGGSKINAYGYNSNPLTLTTPPPAQFLLCNRQQNIFYSTHKSLYINISLLQLCSIFKYSELSGVLICVFCMPCHESWPL